MMVEAILRLAARAEGAELEQLLAPGRAPAAVAARRLAARLLRLEGYSYPEAGRALRRHHTSVLALVRCADCGAHVDVAHEPGLACAVCGSLYWSPAGRRLLEALPAERWARVGRGQFVHHHAELQ